MLCIDKSCDTASFLYLSNRMQGNGRLTTGLRSIDLDDSSFRSPPKPSAISRLNDPVGIVSTFICAELSPSFMMEPLPYCFSICEIAASNAFNLSFFTALISLYLSSFAFLSSVRTYVRFFCSNSIIFFRNVNHKIVCNFPYASPSDI